MKVIFLLVPILLLSSCSSKGRKKISKPAPVCYRNYDQGFENKINAIAISNELWKCQQLVSFKCEAPEGVTEFHVKQMKRLCCKRAATL